MVTLVLCLFVQEQKNVTMMMKVWTESLPESSLKLKERLVCCPSCARREKERVKGWVVVGEVEVQLVQRSEEGAL